MHYMDTNDEKKMTCLFRSKTIHAFQITLPFNSQLQLESRLNESYAVTHSTLLAHSTHIYIIERDTELLYTLSHIVIVSQSIDTNKQSHKSNQIRLLHISRAFEIISVLNHYYLLPFTNRHFVVLLILRTSSLFECTIEIGKNMNV